MTKAELIEWLRQTHIPDDIQIFVKIQTEAGFYDVRPKYASGRLRSAYFDEVLNQLTLEA